MNMDIKKLVCFNLTLKTKNFAVFWCLGLLRRVFQNTQLSRPVIIMIIDKAFKKEFTTQNGIHGEPFYQLYCKNYTTGDPNQG